VAGSEPCQSHLIIRRGKITVLLTAASPRLAIGDRHDNHVAQMKPSYVLRLQAEHAQAHHRKDHMRSPLEMSRISIDCVCRLGSDTPTCESRLERRVVMAGESISGY
jgi:hypothetical protein